MERFRVSDCCFLSIPKSGYRLIWEVTQYCPYSCEYCFTWSSPQREIFECDINTLISKMTSLIEIIGVNDVLITGGEPLAVSNEIIPFLTYLSNCNIPFSISTNLYDEDLFSAVSQCQPRTVNLSVDPPSSEYNRSVFKANFALTDSKLKVVESTGHKVKLTALISRGTYRNVPTLLNYLGEAIATYKNIDRIAFNREYPIGFAAGSKVQTKTELGNTFNAILKWSKLIPVPVSMVNWSEFHAPLQNCPAGQSIVSVQQNGDVTPCSLLYNITRSFTAGNILRDPMDLITSRLGLFAQDLVKYYEQTEHNTPSCKTCRYRMQCGGGCLAALPIASNHIPRRTCEVAPRRIKDHERSLISEFHHSYHELYSPEPKPFVVANEKLSEDVEERIRDYVSKKLVPSDLAHTMDHIDCVVKLAKLISEEEGASQKITIPAAYFHDIAPREAAMHHMHTYKSATLAGYLQRINDFTPEEIKHIQYCIITSSYGSYLLGYKPLSLEAKVVRDADWLDAIGARGIARVFAFEQAHGAKEMGYPVDDPEGLPIRVDMNITGPDASPIYHFFTKLLKIYGLLETTAGKRIGKERHNYMVDFIKRYQSEIDLKIPESQQLVLKFIE